MKVLFLLISLCVLPITALGQVSGVMAEYGQMLPSRGAFTVVRGQNLSNGLTELAVDVANLPTELAGVVVDISGVKCGLRYVSPDTIRLVIPDETPFVPPVRLRPNVLTVRNSAGQVWMRRVYLNDTSPWLLPELHTQFPVGVQYSLASGMQPVKNGVIYAGNRVQLWATGARSFYPADWVSYSIWVIDEHGSDYSLPASVTRFDLVAGVDLVTFDVPDEWNRMGRCRLILQTPSAFSQEVEVTFGNQ